MHSSVHTGCRRASAKEDLPCDPCSHDVDLGAAAGGGGLSCVRALSTLSFVEPASADLSWFRVLFYSFLVFV